MIAEPLTREEREIFARDRAYCPSECDDCAQEARWEATVQAETARADAAEERAERAHDYLLTARAMIPEGVGLGGVLELLDKAIAGDRAEGER